MQNRIQETRNGNSKKSDDISVLQNLLQEIGNLSDIRCPVKGIDGVMNDLFDEERFYRRLYLIGLIAMPYRHEQDQERGLIRPWKKRSKEIVKEVV